MQIWNSNCADFDRARQLICNLKYFPFLCIHWKARWSGVMSICERKDFVLSASALRGNVIILPGGVMEMHVVPTSMSKTSSLDLS